MQLALDSVDRLVELIEERGPLPVDEAARELFKVRALPRGLARQLLQEVLAGDARLSSAGDGIRLAGSPDPPLERTRFVVFDLETTGLSRTSSRVCEIGAAEVVELELRREFQTFVDPGVPLPSEIAALTGIRDSDLRGTPAFPLALRRFLDFAGEAVLVAHNARFDTAFLERGLERLDGRKLARPVLDTVALARRLLSGKADRLSLAALARYFGTSVEPCHRALADAQATAEILIQLVGLAQERGARTMSDLHELAAPRKRRVYGKRALAHGAPNQPGVYLFRGRGDEVLYVGRARDLRARLRSYFRSDRQRPAIEAALAALERIEWRIHGSELEAALEELRLIRELRPPANARGLRPDRYVYLRLRGQRVIVTRDPGPWGPIRSRRRAELAARALHGASAEDLDRLLDGGPLDRLRSRLRDLSDCLRYEDAARLRDRIAALEQVVESLRRLQDLRGSRFCIVAPALEAGWRRAFFVGAGRICAIRSLPPGPGAQLELDAGTAAARIAASRGPSYSPEDADELLLLAGFVKRPPPELEIHAAASGAA